MNPNHYLAVAIDYLYGGARPRWAADGFIGKTLVSSSMIDRVATALDRRLVEVPVGFKWFVPGLLDGSGPFGGEESAGASFARFDGSVWSTDRTASSSPCSPRRSSPRRASPQRALRRAHRAVWRPGVCPHRRSRDPGAEGQAGRAVPCGRHGGHPRR